MSKLTLPQVRKLKDLKQKFQYDLALFKKDMNDLELSDKQMLDAMLIMELNEAITTALNPILQNYVENNIIEQHDLSDMLATLFLSLGVGSTEDNIENDEGDGGARFSEELLFAYSDLNPNVKALVFKDDEIEIYDINNTIEEGEEFDD